MVEKTKARIQIGKTSWGAAMDKEGFAYSENVANALEICLFEYVEWVNRGQSSQTFGDSFQSDITAACQALVARGILRQTPRNPSVYALIKKKEIRRSITDETFNLMIEAFFRCHFPCHQSLPPETFSARSPHEEGLFSGLCDIGLAERQPDGSFLWLSAGVEHIIRW